MNKKTILGFAVGPIGAAAFGFVTKPIMTWIFPQEAIGQLSMLQIAIQFFILFFCFGFDQAYVREYYEESNKPALLLNTLFPGLLLLIAVLVGLYIFDTNYLPSLLFGEQGTVLFILISICFTSAFISRFLSLILRMQNRGLAFSMSQILSKIILLTTILAFAFSEYANTFIYLLGAQVISLFVTFLVFGWNTQKDWLPVFNERFQLIAFKKHLAFGAPLILAGLASWGMIATSQLLLRKLAGFEELGLYSIAVSVAAATTIFSQVFNVIWAPLVFKWIANDEDVSRIDNVAKQLSNLLVVFVLLVGATSWILGFVLPSEYKDTVYLVLSCMLGPLLYTLSEVTGIGITVTRKTNYAILASGVAVLINAAVCFWLIPIMGARGAAIATAVSFWVFYLVRTEVSAAIWRKIPRLRIHMYVLFTLVVSISYIVYGMHFEFYENGLFFTGLMLAFIVLNKNSFIQMFRLILNKMC